jgi:hypothetical protein
LIIEELGGLGHDPKSFPVRPEINKNNAVCFSDQNIAEAEELMRFSKSDSNVSLNKAGSEIGKLRNAEEPRPVLRP